MIIDEVLVFEWCGEKFVLVVGCVDNFKII